MLQTRSGITPEVPEAAGEGSAGATGVPSLESHTHTHTHTVRAPRVVKVAVRGLPRAKSSLLSRPDPERSNRKYTNTLEVIFEATQEEEEENRTKYRAC